MRHGVRPRRCSDDGGGRKSIQACETLSKPTLRVRRCRTTRVLVPTSTSSSRRQDVRWERCHSRRSRPHRPCPPCSARGRATVQGPGLPCHGGLSPPAGDEPGRLHRLHPRHTRPGSRQTCRRPLAPQLRQRARLSPRRCQLGLPAPWPLPTPGRRPSCATRPRPSC